MTDRGKIIALALRCGFVVEPYTNQIFVTDAYTEVQCTRGLEAFYHEAQAEAFEQAALVCTDRSAGTDHNDFDEWDHCNYSCAEAIRALKEK